MMARQTLLASHPTYCTWSRPLVAVMRLGQRSRHSSLYRPLAIGAGRLPMPLSSALARRKDKYKRKRDKGKGEN